MYMYLDTSEHNYTLVDLCSLGGPCTRKAQSVADYRESEVSGKFGDFSIKLQTRCGNSKGQCSFWKKTEIVIIVYSIAGRRRNYPARRSNNWFSEVSVLISYSRLVLILIR